MMGLWQTAMLSGQCSQPFWSYGEMQGGPAATPQMLSSQLRENSRSYFLKNKYISNHSILVFCLFIACFFVPWTIFPINTEFLWLAFYFIPGGEIKLYRNAQPLQGAWKRGGGAGAFLKPQDELGLRSRNIFITHSFYLLWGKEKEMTLMHYGVASTFYMDF